MNSIYIPDHLYPKYQKFNKLYNDYIKLHFKFKLSDNPEFIDYGILKSIYYKGFWFRITNNYKIDIRIDNKNTDYKIIKEKLEEITKIIQKYYPDLYNL